MNRQPARPSIQSRLPKPNPSSIQPQRSPPTHSHRLWTSRAHARYPARRTSTSLDATFSALADPTRRALLERLAQAELSVTELAKPFQMSLPAISKHLSVLEESGLITREKDGRIHRCRLDPTPLISTLGWIARYRPLWEKHLDALGSYLEETNTKERQ